MLSGATLDDEVPVVLKLEDGFEKRYHVHCRRCDLNIGYRLDKSQFGGAEVGVESGVLYLLRGGLLSTEEMKDGKKMGGDAESVGSDAG